MAVASIVLVCVAGLITLSTASIDHDGWEFYGGRRRSLKHGLNMATADAAPRNGGRVRFDEQPQIVPELLVTNDEAPPAQPFTPNLGISTDRIKSKEELLLLPDRFSVLDFDSKEEDDKSSYWGRLYINGFPNSLQYFRADFGIPPPPRAVEFVLASPLNMCDEDTGLPVLDNASNIGKDSVVVTLRGGCTFGEKASAAREAGAAGIVFVNNEEGLFHASGPDARDVLLSASMITQHDGHHLIQALRTVAATPGSSLVGRFVPIMCNNSDDSDTPYCSPVHHADARFESLMDYGGKVLVDESAYFEYTQAEFGSWIDPFAEWNTIVPTAIGGDAHCCDRALFEGNDVSNTTAVMCLRGECPFVEKAENVALMGAKLAIVGSHNQTLTRMGCDPQIRGRKVNAAVVMVSNDAYEHMASQFYTQLDAGSSSNIRLSQYDSVCKGRN